VVVGVSIFKGLFVGINVHEKRFVLPWDMEGEAGVGPTNVCGDDESVLGSDSVLPFRFIIHTVAKTAAPAAAMGSALFVDAISLIY